ncbi:MAG TPA: 3'-5' exonuclease [Clostridiales bacterium]|nr:3'-5' exonuclease [Clostridiales bacterium]HQP70365.1 3'-5' exonuclease [Clostridiales bacterium]
MKYNDSQIQAIEHFKGPCLVLAGAGSGKTRVIVGRIERLINDHRIDPKNILAVTFTNKAAQEMRERLAASVKGHELMTCSTFHALGVRLIKENLENLGYSKGFSIYGSAEQHAAIKKAMHNLNISDEMFDPKLISYKISYFKNRFISLDNVTAIDPITSVSKRIIPEYDRILKANNALDFDDLLLKMLELFKDKSLLEKYQNRYRFILIDEFQDTNPVQNRIVLKLGEKYGNVFVVGDDDQSIYGFRGADFRNILDFEKHWDDCRIIILNVNYRSTPTILKAASAVINNNLERKNKQVETHFKEHLPIEYFSALNEKHEADLICEKIKELGKRYSDHAVLLRTNYLSRVIEEAFRTHRIPYKIVGDYKFYERKEIRDILAYMSIVVNPSDEVSVLRIINTPKRGIGEDTVFKISNYAEQNKINFFQALKSYKKIDTIASSKHHNIAEFLDLVTGLVETGEQKDIYDTCVKLVDKTGYFAFLEKENDKSIESRKANVDELLNSVKDYAAENKNGTLNGFLEKIALIQEGDDTDRGEQVIVLTVHSSKGLEFENVFIAGFEEGIFPHKRSLDEDNIEEERRLCYVALTRAKKRLYISSCVSRVKYGEESKSKPSRFLKEIPDELFLYPPAQAGEKSAENAKSKIREMMERLKDKYKNEK